jgi:hypothetical protein
VKLAIRMLGTTAVVPALIALLTQVGIPKILDVPQDQFLISAGEWSYSPVNEIRERSACLLYLRSDGTALQLLGNIFETTTETPAIPQLSMTSLFKLEMGKWTAREAKFTVSLKCLGSMYVTPVNGKNPCGSSQLMLTQNGRHLIDKTNYYEPAAGVYPESYRQLLKQFFEECCRNEKVATSFPECRKQ